MRETVRKRILRLTVTFTPKDDTLIGLQPTSASATMYFTSADTGEQTSETFSLSLQDDDTWSGTWDSKVAAAGEVKWSAVSAGPVIASVDGQFLLRANEANLET